MAPDIDSLPPSPYRTHSSTDPRRPAAPRRLSDRTAPASTITTNPTFSSTPPPRSPILSSPLQNQNANLPREDNTGVDPGPGPLRHPRPLTAADLHMQLEKEQEAVVNRLTRELTLLRQQTASVASTTSSTSTGHGVPDTEHSTLLGASHPMASRRHRSSSNLSSRSAQHNNASGVSSSSSSAVGTTAGIAGSTSSGIAPPRDHTGAHHTGTTTHYTYNRGGDPLSRQSSAASRRSDASSPSLSAPFMYQGEHIPGYAHRHSNSISGGAAAGGSTAPLSSQSTGPGAVSMSRGNSHVAPTPRYDDAMHARAELEMVKAENEALKQRIRELERERSLSSTRTQGTAGAGAEHERSESSAAGGANE